MAHELCTEATLSLDLDERLEGLRAILAAQAVREAVAAQLEPVPLAADVEVQQGGAGLLALPPKGKLTAVRRASLRAEQDGASVILGCWLESSGSTMPRS